MVIGWIGLALSGCVTQSLNQRGSNAGLGLGDAIVCRHELNEAPAKGDRDRDVLHRSEARAAVGLTGLMGGVYAEALGVHQLSIGQSEAKQSGGLQVDKTPDEREPR